MTNVLPQSGILTVNNVYYRYTIDKETSADTKVHIRNINAVDGGYIFNQTDDWNQLPGSTINKMIPTNDIPREYWGNGSITVEGEGSLSNPSVAYGYKINLCQANPLYSPQCPGYIQALYQWLLDNGLIGEDIDINDPLLDEYVQKALDDLSETDKPEELKEQIVEEEEKEEQSMEDKLAVGGAAEKIANAAQQASVMRSLSTVPAFEKYYKPMIPGGEYNDSIELQDGEISDNTRALRNLAQDGLHRDMVRSQYDNIKNP